MASCSEGIRPRLSANETHRAAHAPVAFLHHLESLRSGEVADLPGTLRGWNHSIKRYASESDDLSVDRPRCNEARPKCGRAGLASSLRGVPSLLPAFWALLQFRRCSSGRAFQSWPPTFEVSSYTHPARLPLAIEWHERRSRTREVSSDSADIRPIIFVALPQPRAGDHNSYYLHPNLTLCCPTSFAGLLVSLQPPGEFQLFGSCGGPHVPTRSRQQYSKPGQPRGGCSARPIFWRTRVAFSTSDTRRSP